MVRLIQPYSNPIGAEKEADRLMAVMDKGDDGDDGLVTYPEFAAASRRLGTVMYPAFMLQRALRSKAMDSKFWKKATKKRAVMATEGYGDDLIEM